LDEGTEKCGDIKGKSGDVRTFRGICDTLKVLRDVKKGSEILVVSGPELL
jgi:hypothetical protein